MIIEYNPTNTSKPQERIINRVHYAHDIPADETERMTKIQELYKTYPSIESLFTNPTYLVEQHGKQFIPKQLILTLIVTIDQTELNKEQMEKEYRNIQTWKNQYQQFDTNTTKLEGYNKQCGFYTIPQATHLVLFLVDKYSQNDNYSLRNTTLQQTHINFPKQPDTKKIDTVSNTFNLSDADGNQYIYDPTNHTLSFTEQKLQLNDQIQRLLFHLHIDCQSKDIQPTKKKFAEILDEIRQDKTKTLSPEEAQLFNHAFEQTSRRALQQFEDFYTNSFLAQLNAQHENPNTHPILLRPTSSF